ncbi:hypothetical protein pb186bvf_006731 [Paramecium bursaria]
MHQFKSPIKTIFSTKSQQTLGRNQTLDIDKFRPKNILQDKESLFDENQGLKQENNLLRQALKHYQSKLQYYKKEVSSMTKEDISSVRQSTKVKVGYLDKINKLEEDIGTLQKQLYDAKKYIDQLQSPLSINPDVACMQLQQDNIRLTQIVENQEKEIIDLNNQLTKANTKQNAIQLKYNAIKKLNQQVLGELQKMKSKDTLFQPKIKMNQSIKEQENLQTELDQVKIDLRTAEKRIQQLETKLKITLGEAAEHQDQLEKKIIELSKKNEQQLKQFDEEKLQFNTRFAKRTIMIKTTMQQDDDVDETEQVTRKLINVEKSDLHHISKLVKWNLISKNIQLSQVDQYLLSGEQMTQQQIFFQLKHPVFGIDDDMQINQLATYLADANSDNELTNSARIRSIFRTLMDNYVVLKNEQLQEINQIIQKKKGEITDLIQRRYPDVFLSNQLNLDTYIDILNQVEVHLNKQQLENLMARIYCKNGKQKILLSQIYNPIEEQKVEESISKSQPPIIIKDDVSVKNIDNPMASESDLDIQMVNSQELKKKSQSELTL